MLHSSVHYKCNLCIKLTDKSYAFLLQYCIITSTDNNLLFDYLLCDRLFQNRKMVHGQFTERLCILPPEISKNVFSDMKIV